MTKSLEEIVGKFERERVITGTRPNERRADTVRYVSFDREEDPGEVFGNVVEKVHPPLVKSGGVMLDGGFLTLPDGTQFYPLVLNGDLDGFRRQIEQGAKELGLLTGKIVGDDFLVSDGRTYPLVACSVVFD